MAAHARPRSRRRAEAAATRVVLPAPRNPPTKTSNGRLSIVSLSQHESYGSAREKPHASRRRPRSTPEAPPHFLERFLRVVILRTAVVNEELEPISHH